MNPTLVFDIGMHVGDDTAYYLSKGYRVVAVEANPLLVRQAEQRFQQQVDDGLLILENCVIANTVDSEEVDFWVCNEDSGLSSFDRAMASRLGYTCHSVRVRSSRLSTLIQKYQIPLYLKIDIEGLDHMAISDVPTNLCPKYLSMEISSIDDFILLKNKGYTKFKCVQQGTFSSIQAAPFSIRSVIKQSFKTLRSSPQANLLRSAVKAFKPVSRAIDSSAEWRFTLHSSGPFAEDTAGEWLTFEQVLHAWLDYTQRDILGYEAWYDLHAKLS